VVNPINVAVTGTVTFNTAVIVGTYFLNFKQSFDTLTILNESAYNLVINGMQTQTASRVTHVALTGTPFPNLGLLMAFWLPELIALGIPPSYSANTDASYPSTQVSIRNLGTSNITVAAEIHNVNGATTITNVGGNILSGISSPGVMVETNNLALTAGGTIGTSGSRVSANLMGTNGTAPSLTASGHGDVFLTLKGFFPEDSADVVKVPTLHSDAHLNLQILQTVEQGFLNGRIVLFPVTGSYILSQVTASSDITVNAARTSLDVGQMSSTSGSVSITTTGAGNLLAQDSTSQVNISAGTVVLNTGGDIGQPSHHLKTAATSLTDSSGTHKIYLDNTPPG
jgi:hypothetical protein